MFDKRLKMCYNGIAKITHSCVTIRYLHPPVRVGVILADLRSDLNRWVFLFQKGLPTHDAMQSVFQVSL